MLLLPCLVASVQVALVIENVNVIDTTGGPTLRNHTVIIRDRKIVAVEPFGKAKIPDNCQLLNAKGRYLIPGLWDMHIHTDDAKQLALFTANGVTGARVMFGFKNQQQWKKDIEAGKLIGPHLVLGSPIVDGPKPIWPSSIAVTSPEQARKVVNDIKADGWDFVKVYQLLPRDSYLAIADEAKKRGIPFAGHVGYGVSVSEASDAGQKSIEHLTGVMLDCSPEGDELRKLIAPVAGDGMMAIGAFAKQHPVDAVFERFRRNGTWQCPTITVLRSMAYLDDPKLGEDSRLQYMPPAYRKEWDPKNDFRLKTRTAEDWQKAKTAYEQSRKLVRMMNAANVPMLAGTDCLNPYCFPGFSLHDELASLVECGLTPMKALQTATLNPAKFLGREKSMGTVSVGKIADLVLLEKDPLLDISNTKRIVAVIQSGKLYNNLALAKILERAKTASAKSTGAAGFAGHCLDH
jgi:imidazolonepropionase-like amidohydrolase